MPRGKMPVAPTQWGTGGTCPPLLQMAGNGGLYCRFPDGNFPGRSFSRKDVCRIVFFPDDTFPGKTIPGSSLSQKMIPEL